MVGPAHPIPMTFVGRGTCGTVQLVVHDQLMGRIGSQTPRDGPMGRYQSGFGQLPTGGGRMGGEPRTHGKSPGVVVWR